MVPAESAVTERPLRADARRNRERLLAVAAEVFAEQGIDVGVAEISRRSGVGSATLFRNFPTKDDLIWAVLEQRLTEIEVALDEALNVADSWDAIAGFLLAFVRMQARDRALIQAFTEVFEKMPPERIAERKQGMHAGLATLLARAQEDGVVRDDLVPEDMMILGCAAGACTPPDPSHPELHERYLGVVLDGMRPLGATPLPVGPPA
jgi:AcrR family transcriptional regulator